MKKTKKDRGGRKKSLEFEGEVLAGRYAYEIVDEVGNGFTELRGILKDLNDKKVHIIIIEL